MLKLIEWKIYQVTIFVFIINHLHNFIYLILTPYNFSYHYIMVTSIDSSNIVPIGVLCVKGI